MILCYHSLEEFEKFAALIVLFFILFLFLIFVLFFVIFFVTLLVFLLAVIVIYQRLEIGDSLSHILLSLIDLEGNNGLTSRDRSGDGYLAFLGWYRRISWLRS